MQFHCRALASNYFNPYEYRTLIIDLRFSMYAMSTLSELWIGATEDKHNLLHKSLFGVPCSSFKCKFHWL